MTVKAQFTDDLLRAWRGELDFNQLIDIASRLQSEQFSPLAIVLYQTWLGRIPSSGGAPLAHVAWFNLGTLLSTANDLTGADAAYREAIRISPAFLQPRLNLGLLLERLGKIDDALTEWHWVEENIPPAVTETRPMVVLALNNLGRALENRKRNFEALGFLTRSLHIDPQQPDALQHWIHLRQKLCLWPAYATLPRVSPVFMQDSTSALALLSLSDDPVAQLNAARRFVEKKVKAEVPRLAPTTRYKHPKIRVAYVSSDFTLHPVAMLTVELFELHDRNRFEVYGYCWSPEDGSTLRQRVIQAMDHFVRIDKMSDEEAARRICADEIDILVDLQGQTAGARAGLLAWRPAPVQITYLGLPATTGLPSIDYVIADRFLIPEDAAPHYSETPLYMPDVYQVSDRQRKVGTRPSRASCGLPEDGFVFCSFNNNFKFTAEVFEAWLRILERVPGSVLWLLADTAWSEANLRTEAERRGMDQNRLIFAPRVSPEDYLARYQAADLFLDSFPFNAGTTANDALWMGLPVLTLSGRSFASRMAGALLTAAGLDELITWNLKDYEDKAVALASNPADCQRLRQQLQQVRENGVLFDTPRFVKHLEAQFQRLIVALPPPAA